MKFLQTLNKPEDFILAIGQIENNNGKLVYIRRPFEREREFPLGVLIYKLHDLIS